LFEHLEHSPLFPPSPLQDYDVLAEAVKVVERSEAGITCPGKWEHWYNGKDPIKRALVAEAKAKLKARRDENKRLAWLASGWNPYDCLRGPERTQASLAHLRRLYTGERSI
jgi:hypothetical protein